MVQGGSIKFVGLLTFFEMRRCTVQFFSLEGFYRIRRGSPLARLNNSYTEGAERRRRRKGRKRAKHVSLQRLLVSRRHALHGLEARVSRGYIAMDGSDAQVLRCSDMSFSDSAVRGRASILRLAPIIIKKQWRFPEA